MRCWPRLLPDARGVALQPATSAIPMGVALATAALYVVFW